MLRTIGALGISCLFLVGCVDPQKRLEIAELAEQKKDLAVPIVADVANFDNTGPLKVQGVALVTGLAGTGHCPTGYYRNLMEQYLLKNSGPRGGEMPNVPTEQNVRQVLDNPNNCLVIVTGFIPGGARKGDRFDVDVTLPDGSKASSLAGGTLKLSLLRVYEATANISNNPNNQNSSQILGGHIFAQAKGQLVVGFGNNADATELKRGKVWYGGESRIHRPYALIMRNDAKSIRIANDVAQRLNFMYQEDPRSRALHADFNDAQKQILLNGSVTQQLNQAHDPSGMGATEMAKAASKDVINVRVPFGYRLDHDRFLHVASVTPLRNGDPNMTGYRQRLQKMLLDPRDTLLAARRLEALGRDSIPSLKPGLESKHPMVRFASAEALAYLGSTLGVEGLTELVQEHSILAKNGTMALANLGESICRDKLAVLLTSDDRALRCAAFHALTLVDESDPRMGGLFLNDTLWLYRIPNAPSPMVYYSTSQRPQVALFGRGIVLSPETRTIIRADYTVVHEKNDGKFYVKRITTRGEEKRVCSNRLDEVLTALTELGATYPDIVEFLRVVDDRQYANCPIVNWTVPEVTLLSLIESGRLMKNGQ